MEWALVSEQSSIEALGYGGPASEPGGADPSWTQLLLHIYQWELALRGLLLAPRALIPDMACWIKSRISLCSEIAFNYSVLDFSLTNLTCLTSPQEMHEYTVFSNCRGFFLKVKSVLSVSLEAPNESKKKSLKWKMIWKWKMISNECSLGVSVNDLPQMLEWFWPVVSYRIKHDKSNFFTSPQSIFLIVFGFIGLISRSLWSCSEHLQ